MPENFVLLKRRAAAYLLEEGARSFERRRGSVRCSSTSPPSMRNGAAFWPKAAGTNGDGLHSLGL